MQHAVGGTHLRARPIVLSVALFLLLTLLVIVPASPARAATFAVNDTLDVAAVGDVTNGVCDNAGGNCTLRSAVEEANGTAGADVITLTAATYILSIAGTAEEAGATGDLDITSNVTINGAAGGTTIDANSIDRVFHVLSGGSLTLNDVTITGGAAATGAGIQVDSGGTLDLNTSTLTGNAATSHGGAIHATGNVTADLSTISGNTAGGDGAGFYSAGGAHTLTSTTVAYNTATGIGGGVAQNAGTVTIGHTILSNNAATTSGNQCSGAIGSDDRNVIAAIAGCTFTPAANDSTGSAAGLVALADNGGPTQTHALNGTSVALDVGGTCSADDQRGITRGASCDAGAFESIQVEFNAAIASRAESVGTYNVAVTIDGTNPYAATTVTVGQTGGTATLGTDYTLSNTNVSFPAGTTAPQSATLTITDDDFGEGDETAILGLSGATGAVLGAFDTHTLTITDNESVGITLTPTSLTVEEDGSDSYQIVLDSEPTADVTVTFNDGTEADAGFGAVTFTSANWDIARNVVVTVPDNLVADGTRADAITHTVTSTDLDYDGLDPTLPVTINDDDAVAIFVTETGGNTAVSEATPGTTDSYSVVLGSAPVGTVVITHSFEADQVLVTPASRSFGPGDWDTPKSFTVTVVDDDIDEAATHVSTITHSVTAGSDPAYAALTPDPVAVDITDDDEPGITLAPTSLTVAENAFNTYQIVLDSEPTDDVVVVFNDGIEADAGFASVTFTSANWDVARNVVVSVPNNGVADGTRADAITHTVTSSDGDYDELNPTVPVNITDDDGQPQVEILDVTQVETDGTTTFVFNVTVSPVSTSPITVTYSTATAGVDPADPSEYESITNATLVIPALAAADTIEVEAYGDDNDEDAERFRVNAVGIAGGELVDTFALGTINDDDDTPVADNDTYNVGEGATLNVGVPGGVLNGDTDGDSGSLNALLQAAPADHVGVFTLDANGSFTYENDGDDGPDTFTYRASDGSNLSALATVTINVANVAPTVSINENPGSGPEGTQIDLTSVVSDPGNDTISRSWSVTKNGGAFDTGAGPGFSFTPDDNGTYVVLVTANDGDGGSGTDSITINVTNVAPTVSINENPVSGPEGTAIALTSAVSDPGDDVITRSWSVTKNGAAFDTGVGPGFSFTPDDNGTYVATVTANDGEGGTNSDSVSVNVTNVAPNVTINQDPGTGTEGTPIALTSTVSDPGTADTFTRSWSVTKNGSAFDTGTGFSYTLTPDDNGTYVVTVTAIDDDGGSNMDSITVVVSNADPTVSIVENPGNGPEGTQIDLTSTVSDPGDDVITRSWSVTKNAAAFDTGNGPAFSFTPDDDGAYVVTVTANDGEGGSDTDSITITGTNVDPTVSINENPGSVPEGTPVALTSTATDPGDDVIARSWTVTKGGVPFANDNGPSFSFTPDDNATYVVTVVATDGDGGTGSDNITITGSNVDPTVTIVQDPGTGPEGTLIALTSTVSDPGDDVITRSWSVTKNGAAFDSGNGPAFSFTPNDDGTYVVTVTANDGDGGSGVDSITINVTNLDPTVSIVGAPASSPEGTEISLTSTVSDPGNDTITRSWSVTKNGAAFGTPANGPAYSFTPDDNGTYVVTLVATDGDGGSDTDTATINVTNLDPTVSIVGAPASGPEGTQIDLTSTVSDPGDDVITRAWSVTKNGAAFSSGNGPAFSFTPDDNGTYVVTLVASDGEGGSDTDTATINVTNRNPVVTIEGAPASSPEGTQIDLTSTVSDPGTADVISRAWSVTKDGAPFATGSGAAYSFTPDDNASYVVTLVASDDDGGSDTDTATINVTNVGPTVSIDGPATISSPEGTEVALTATVNDPGNDALTLIWTVTKNGASFDSGTGLAFSFTPNDNATYVVTLDADDSEGGTDSDSMTVNATNVAPVVPPPAGGSIDEGGSFALSAPFTDAGQAETHTAVVNWGDGTVEDCSVSPNCDLTQTDGLSGTVTGTHTYDDDGPWTVTVTVSDGIGSDPGATTVNVANVAPTVDTPTPDTIFEGDTYSFAGAFTDPGAGDTWSAEVNYDNGAGWQPLTLSGMTFALSNTYNNDSPAPHDVRVCVADDDQGPSPHLDGTCQSAAVETLNAAPVVTARDDADVDEGVTVWLTGATPTSFTDAGVLDTHTATIDWGEGAGPVAATVNPDDTVSGGHQYNVPGFYTVTVTVTDDAGDSHSDTFTVNVRNLNFQVNVSGPISRNEGGNLSISGDFSDSDGAGSYELVVDWGDGSPPETISHTPTAAGEGTFSAGPHTYADDSDCVSAPGSCTLTVTVDDTADPQDEATNGYTVTVINKVPTTAIAGPTTSPEGTGFKLFGNPKDVFADTLTYEWTVTKDTGDGPAVFKTGAFKNIWFQPDDGCATCAYEATFVVTDDDGGVSDPEVWTVNVTNVKPDAQMLDEFGNTLPPVYDGGTEGTTVGLQAVFTDPGAADTHTITWEAKLLDQVIDTGNEPTFDFVAPDNGAYFVVLTVTDDDGGTDTPGSPLITVSNAPPKITNLVTDPTPSVGTPVALNVFFTDAGVGDEHTVTVDWGDGSPIATEANATSPAALSHTFAAGAYRAKICVVDDDGAKKCKKIWYNAGASPAGTGADFNGDGIEDMAVGVPGENSGAGAVNVFYGSSSGPSLTGDKFYRQGINGVLGTSENGDEFGATLAYGDFNGDGYDDLAIGAPGEKLGGKNNAGSVNVLYGSASGLNANGDQLWTQDSNSVADSSQKGDRFADGLAVGDFNGDGFADLAIGVPGEDISGTSNAGRVQVLFGGPSKLVAGFSQSWHQGVKGVLDNKQGSDRYGSSLVAGDFDRDGFWDLAIGVPGQKVAGKSKAGAVAVLPGSVLGLTAEDDQVWNQNKPGINDSAESGDQYGLVLASGDFNADGFADLAVGIPLEGVSGLSDTGAVSVIYGTGTGLASDGDQFWNENSTDIYGAAEADDQFGFALAVGDAGNNGFDDLLVGVPNQAIGGDAEAGVVALIRGGGSGLAAVGNQRWHEDRSGTPGKAQPGDHFGAAVAFADVTGDGRDDLMAGIPGQNFTPTDVGAVMMVKGHSSGGFTNSGSKWYHQNMRGVAGDGSETNDQFGAAL